MGVASIVPQAQRCAWEIKAQSALIIVCTQAQKFFDFAVFFYPKYYPHGIPLNSDQAVTKDERKITVNASVNLHSSSLNTDIFELLHMHT